MAGNTSFGSDHPLFAKQMQDRAQFARGQALRANQFSLARPTLFGADQSPIPGTPGVREHLLAAAGLGVSGGGSPGAMSAEEQAHHHLAQMIQRVDDRNPLMAHEPTNPAQMAQGGHLIAGTGQSSPRVPPRPQGGVMATAPQAGTIAPPQAPAGPDFQALARENLDTVRFRRQGGELDPAVSTNYKQVGQAQSQRRQAIASGQRYGGQGGMVSGAGPSAEPALAPASRPMGNPFAPTPGLLATHERVKRGLAAAAQAMASGKQNEARVHQRYAEDIQQPHYSQDRAVQYEHELAQAQQMDASAGMDPFERAIWSQVAAGTMTAQAAEAQINQRRSGKNLAGPVPVPPQPGTPRQQPAPGQPALPIDFSQNLAVPGAARSALGAAGFPIDRAFPSGAAEPDYNSLVAGWRQLGDAGFQPGADPHRDAMVASLLREYSPEGWKHAHEGPGFGTRLAANPFMNPVFMPMLGYPLFGGTREAAEDSAASRRLAEFQRRMGPLLQQMMQQQRQPVPGFKPPL